MPSIDIVLDEPVVKTIKVAGLDGDLTTTLNAVEKIPYFLPLLSGRWTSEEALSCSLKYIVLYPCVAYAESNFEKPSVLLTKLESSAGTVLELVQAMDFLGIPIPTVSSMTELVQLEKKLKDTKAEGMERVCKRTYARSGVVPNRSGARDAASTLCFSLIQNSLETSDHKVRVKVTNDVLYVVSHAKTFRPRLRKHVWRTFDSLVCPTDKQQKQFDNWVAGDKLDFDLDDSDEDKESCTDGEGSTGSIHEDYDDYDY